MKKFLFLLLSMAVITASAAVTKTALPKTVAKYSNKAKTEMVSKFKVSHDVKATPVLKAPVTEQPAGEVKTYIRSGASLSVVDGYIELVDQDGFIDLIFAEDNIVWFKNIFYLVEENFGESYVYGVLSEDGTKITVPMGQSIYWSDYFSADVVLSFGTTSVGSSSIVWTPDASVTEVVYAIEGDKLVLQGCGGATPSGSQYPEYEYNGLGSVWTDDGTFGGYLEWETVLTYAVIPNAPVVSVVPGATTANLTWEADEKADGWNLRYRPWTDLSGNPIMYDFALDSYEDYIGEFGIADLDEDGYTWGLAYSSSAQDDLCLYSYSWSSSTGALSPDNLLYTPDVPLKGVLRFTVWGTSDSWPDTYMVYALVGEDLYALFDADQQTTAAHKTVEIDLSQFNGEIGCIIFRHYNCYNQYAIYVDDIYIGDPNAEIIEPAPWTYVYDITDPEYLIEGLTPETKYEVQVMGYNEDYDGAWSEIVDFTTLVAVPDLYILGEVGEQTWDPTAGLKMDYNAEDNLYTATVTFDGRGASGENYFSFTTELAENNDDGGWAYIAPFRYGAVTQDGEDFWYDDMYDGQPLDIAPGQTAFRIMNGEYNITVDLTGLKIIIERVGATVIPGDVNKDGLVNITDVTTLIDHLLNSDFEDADDFSPANADVNGDGDINVGDLAELIDKLLG